MSADVTIRNATRADSAYIAGHLRQADRDELAAGSEMPELAVFASWQFSEICRVACRNGVPCLIFGLVAPLLGERGIVWALGTDDCDHLPVSMVRCGRQVVREFLKVKPLLENWCDARYEKSLRWLKHLGFTVEPPAPHGAKGMSFCHLVARREEHV